MFIEWKSIYEGKQGSFAHTQTKQICMLTLSGGLFEAFKLAQSIPFQMVLNMFPAVETFVTMS